MTEDKRYLLAKLAIEQGDRFQARDHLTSLLKEDQENVEYWLLMSTVVDSKKERIFCLKKVLAIEPRNKEARLGLILFGGVDPGVVKPADIKVKDWSRDLADIHKKDTPKKKQKKTRYNYKQLLPLLGGGVIIILVLFFTGLLFPGRGSIFSPKLTITPITWTPSVDPELAAELTGTPNPIRLTPIGKVLDQPYTPTPVYVLIPHPGYGTYQTALDAYQQGDFETMLTYMRSTADQLETADIVFLVGEALRNLGRYTEAAEEYDRALFLDPNFAPTYYGRALLSKSISPDANIMADLNQTILLDPDYGQAYIERANYYLDQNEYQLAYEDANQAIQLMPNSHLAHLYRGWALLELKDYNEAEIALERALELDINYVPTYLFAGRVKLEQDKPDQAIELLTKYDPYVSDKSWVFYYSLGKAYYLSGQDMDIAEQLLNKAQSLGGEYPDLYKTRALVYIYQGNMQGAVSDAYQARSLDRDDFEQTLFLGTTLHQDNQNTLALVYLNISENLAQSGADLANVYYWRAIVFEDLHRGEDALQDWQNMMDLPREYVPDEWEFFAEGKLLPTSTPTPSITPSPTITPSSTPTETFTPTNTNTPVNTTTPIPIPSLTITP